MKKIIIAMLGFVCIFAFVGCKDNENTNKATAYAINMEIAENLQTATLCTEINYCNSTNGELGEVKVFLYPNAYAKDAKYPAYFSDLARYGGIDITEITVNGQKTDWVLSDTKTVMTIPLATPLAKNESIVIKISANLNIPKCDLRLGFMDKTLNLGNFYPILSVFQDGEWRTDKFSKVGDPFVSENSNYVVTITSKKDLVLASSGDLTEETIDGNKKRSVYTANNARDFALAASYDFKLETSKLNNLTINYYYIKDKDYKTNLNTAMASIATFSNMIGAYPYNTYNVVETDFYYGGMEYPNLSFISNKLANYDEAIIHETAHQWFGCIVGSDAINESWLDEALTTFLSNYYYAANGDIAKYSALRDRDKKAYNGFMAVQKAGEPTYSAVIERPIYNFATNYEYSMIVYNKGSLMFDAIYQVAGDKKITACIKEYFNANQYKIASADDLYAAFAKNKIEIKPLASAWLSDNIVMASTIG